MTLSGYLLSFYPLSVISRSSIAFLPLPYKKVDLQPIKTLLDENNQVIGSISRYHLFNYEKKKFILVDHNEKSQAVNGIENADILEIIDHHRLGTISTSKPVFFSFNQSLIILKQISRFIYGIESSILNFITMIFSFCFFYLPCY